MWGYPVKIGSPHFVDFGRNMEHSPDGKAYLVAHGAPEPDPKPRFGNLSWISGDQIYLLRVTPSIANMNDASKYEFYAGRDAQGKPIWTQRLRQDPAADRLEQQLRLRHRDLQRPAEEVPHVRHRRLAHLCQDELLHPRSERDHRPLAARDLHEGLRRAGLFPEHPHEVHQPRRPDRLAVLLRQLRQRLARHRDAGKAPRQPLRPRPPANQAPGRDHPPENMPSSQRLLSHPACNRM